MVGVKWTKAAWNVRCVRADDWQTTDMTSQREIGQVRETVFNISRDPCFSWLLDVSDITLVR